MITLNLILKWWMTENSNVEVHDTAADYRGGASA